LIVVFYLYYRKPTLEFSSSFENCTLQNPVSHWLENGDFEIQVCVMTFMSEKNERGIYTVNGEDLHLGFKADEVEPSAGTLPNGVLIKKFNYKFHRLPKKPYNIVVDQR
jgi:hypothetical protein